MKNLLITFLKKKNSLKSLDLDKLLEKPKIEKNGDLSLPVFSLSKELKKNPIDISKDLCDELNTKLPAFLDIVKNVGPYLNFYFKQDNIAKDILNSISDGSLFEIKAKKKETIVVEYPSPNTNKALHVGHSRNILLGNSICNILKKTGNKVTKVNLNNNRGIDICKAIVGYELFGEGKTPESEGMKSDHFAAKYYVLFNDKAKKDPSLDEKAQEFLVKWENNDSEARKSWKKFLSWVYKGYSVTYKDYKYKSDDEYFESDIYDKGRDIVLKALKKKCNGFGLEDENGAVFVDLEDVKLGKKYLLRGNGTTLYMTQDLYLAYEKEKKFKADKYVFIVGSEQKYHFDVLFEILDRIGFGGVEKNHHFAFGMVYDKDGKPFSSRKGNAFGADEFLEMVFNKAEKVLDVKSPDLSKKEKEKRIKVIGYGALAFSILKINPLSDINFDLDVALSFEGESCPYVQYAYARIQSVLKKANCKVVNNVDFDIYDDLEMSLIKSLSEFDKVVTDASIKYKPSAIANYLIRVAQKFNEFYVNNPIIINDENVKQARLLICSATAKVIKEGLELLDIEVLDEM